jgi:hypothetical protein
VQTFQEFISESPVVRGDPSAEFKELMEASLSRVFKHTKTRSIGIVTAYRASTPKPKREDAPDEDAYIPRIEEWRKQNEINIKNNQKLKMSIRKSGYGFIKVEGTYPEVDKWSKQEVLVEEISYVVVGPTKVLPTELDDDGNPVDSFVKKIVTPEQAEKKTLAHIKGFKSDMFNWGKMFDQDSVIWKPVNEDVAYLYGTNSTGFPGLKKLENVGPWRPAKIGGIFSKMKKGKDFEFRENADMGTLLFLKPNSFFSRGNNLY